MTHSDEPQNAYRVGSWTTVAQYLQGHAIKIRSNIKRWRTPLFAAAGFLFAFGFLYSVDRLGLNWQDVSLLPLLMIFSVSLASLALAAVNLQLTADAVGQHMKFRRGFAVSAVSRIAELLPIPAGALLRGGALMSVGASVRESASIVTLTALLTLCMGLMLASLPLLSGAPLLGYIVLIGGLAGTVVSTSLIGKRARWTTLAGMIGVRVGVLLVGVVRLALAFAAIGIAVGAEQVAIFVVSGSLGSASSIAPAGLGVSEAIAAALAQLVAIPAEAAFLAVAINRIMGLAMSGLAALICSWGPNARPTIPNR